VKVLRTDTHIILISAVGTINLKYGNCIEIVSQHGENLFSYTFPTDVEAEKEFELLSAFIAESDDGLGIAQATFTFPKT